MKWIYCFIFTIFVLDLVSSRNLKNARYTLQESQDFLYDAFGAKYEHYQDMNEEIQSIQVVWHQCQL